MDWIKNIVLQHYSKQVAAFLLSDTSKLLVWNNQYNSFGLKWYLEFWCLLEVILPEKHFLV